MLTRTIIEQVVKNALAEDAPWGDLTVELTIPQELTMTTQLKAREPGVFAGGELVRETFRQTDSRIEVRGLVADGTPFAAGDTLGEISGAARGILTGERIALNLSQRMSGIATLTARFVAEVAHTGARIADTRKTTPGLRALEKHAVRVGGGSSHRFGLSDAIMVKDNHLAALGADRDRAALAGRELPGHARLEQEDRRRQRECARLDIRRVERARDARAGCQGRLRTACDQRGAAEGCARHQESAS